MTHEGFTLVELVLLIALVGIMAVSAMPKIVNLSDTANSATANAVATSVIVGISLFEAKQMVLTGVAAYPNSLDELPNKTTCSTINPCFANVIKDGVASGWYKHNNIHYTYLPTGTDYKYNPGQGSFEIFTP